ncbi:helix-turn-helix transcriptional regulator [Kribbella sp. NBC_00662]|uniref:helix-turn-helix transcriptional regulator n=1 Tax=Kribbella sp. NBC_00662 TaxID=2975969 RepID=UPI00325548EA
MGLTALFDSSGLTAELLAVYRTLLQKPELGRDTRLSELAAELDQTEDETAHNLQALRELGFLVPSWIEGVEYPLDPSLTFGRLAARRQQEIEALSDELRSDQLAADRFTADLANFLVQRTTRDVEILEGRELANQRMQRFRPKKSIWGINQVDRVVNMDPHVLPDRPHLERGIEIRYIYSEAFWKRPGAPEFVHLLTSLGGTVRIAPSVPFRLVIFDDESAVMGIDPDDHTVGAVVHHSPAVVRLAMELHLSLWDRAVDPLKEQRWAREGGISAQEAEFLRLLVHGATDEQVARKLGVSMRTVRRIAAKLSEQVGASGRFELGVRAAQRGWVD